MRLFNNILIEKEIEKIKNIKGNATELISLYIPARKKIYDIRQYISDELGKVDNIKSSSTRKNVQSALSSILSTLSNYDKTPENGMVIFYGVDSEGNTIRELIIPEDPISTFLYRCDSFFYTKQLEDLFVSDESYGVVVLDLSEASIGVLNGTRVQVLYNTTPPIPNKHNHGGQSSLRFERLRDDAINEYYKRLGEKMTELLLDKPLNGIIIGGPAMTKDDFIKGNYIHHELRKRLLGTVNTSYTNEYGIKEAINAAESLITQSVYMKQKIYIDDFFKKLREDSGLVVYGLDYVRDNLSISKVDTVLLSEDTDTDTLKVIMDIADKNSSNVVIVRKNNEIGEMFSKTFKIGAILRYA